MIIGVMTVDLYLRESHSLKDKRRVLKSLVDRVRTKYNVSIAQTGALDQWQSAVLGLSMVSNEQAHIHKVFSSIIGYIGARGELIITDYQIQTF